MNNFSDNDLNVEVTENENTVAHEETSGVHYSRKTKKKAARYLFLLIPALLLSLYAILEATDSIPARIYLGNMRVRLIGITDNGFMTLLTIVCYAILPITAFVHYCVQNGLPGFLKWLLYGTVNPSAQTDENTSEPAVEETATAEAEEADTVEFEHAEVEVDTLDSELNTALGYEESSEAANEEPESLTEQTSEESPESESEAEVPAVPARPDEIEYTSLALIDESFEGAEPAVFTDAYTLAALCEDLIAFFAEKGYKLPSELARRILASLSSMRCLWVTGKNKEITRTAVGLLGEYFGSAIHESKLLDTEYTTTDLSVTYTREGEFVESGFIRDVYSSNFNRDKFCFAMLSGDFSGGAAKSVIPYLDGAEIDGRVRHIDVISNGSDELKYMSDSKITVSSNVWYILLAYDATGVGIPDHCVAVDLSGVSQCEAVERGEKERIFTSVEKFFDLVRRAKESFYISEEYWRKLDMTEQYISTHVNGFRIDNKEIRGIERYAAVCLSMGGKEMEVVDGIVAGMLIPVLAECPKESIMGEENGIADLVDKTFGMDNVPFTHEILRKFGVA